MTFITVLGACTRRKPFIHFKQSREKKQYPCACIFLVTKKKAIGASIFKGFLLTLLGKIILKKLYYQYHEQHKIQILMHGQAEEKRGTKNTMIVGTILETEPYLLFYDLVLFLMLSLIYGDVRFVACSLGAVQVHFWCINIVHFSEKCVAAILRWILKQTQDWKEGKQLSRERVVLTL